MHHQAPQAAVGAQQEQQLQLLLFQWGHMQQQQKQQQEQQQQLQDQHWEQVQQQQLLLLQQQQLEQQHIELQEVRAQLEQLGRSPSQPAQPEPLEPMLVHIMTRPDLPAVATTHAQTSAIQLLPAPLALGSTSNVVSAIAPATPPAEQPTVAVLPPALGSTSNVVSASAPATPPAAPPTVLVERPMQSPATPSAGGEGSLGSWQVTTVESLALPGGTWAAVGSTGSATSLPGSNLRVGQLAAVGLTPPSTELLNTPALGGMQRQQLQQEAQRDGVLISKGEASSSNGFVVVQQAMANPTFPWPAPYTPSDTPA